MIIELERDFLVELVVLSLSLTRVSVDCLDHDIRPVLERLTFLGKKCCFFFFSSSGECVSCVYV